MNSKKELYGPDFYSTRYRETYYSATRIISIVANLFPHISSAIDFGCGVGTFLDAFKQFNVYDVLGMEGSWLDKKDLLLAESCFKYVDLELEYCESRRYDLAICLEVAEHLSESGGRNLIRSLCGASNLVLFSAAIPSQGGIGHVNEAWQSHWASMFDEYGYKPYDLVRPHIWSDSNIPFWYKQNIIVYTSLDTIDFPVATSPFLDLVHPDLYCSKLSSASPTIPDLIKQIVRKVIS